MISIVCFDCSIWHLVFRVVIANSHAFCKKKKKETYQRIFIQLLLPSLLNSKEIILSKKWIGIISKDVIKSSKPGGFIDFVALINTWWKQVTDWDGRYFCGQAYYMCTSKVDTLIISNFHIGLNKNVLWGRSWVLFIFIFWIYFGQLL